MGQYNRHVFVCTSGETCPVQGDTELKGYRLKQEQDELYIGLDG